MIIEYYISLLTKKYISGLIPKRILWWLRALMFALRTLIASELVLRPYAVVSGPNIKAVQWPWPLDRLNISASDHSLWLKLLLSM